MKFEMLDKKMRAFETNMDQKVLPELYIVARLDGRGFTRLTKDLLLLDRPFDERFRDAMVETVKHLMNCGFKVSYGYTESDEISLLFDAGENGFDRKTRKILSILAGEASICVAKNSFSGRLCDYNAVHIHEHFVLDHLIFSQIP